MDEQTDVERNIAKRTGQKEREEMERETKRAQHRVLFFWLKKREVSLVKTQTDREGDEGREAAVLSKDEAAGEQLRRSLIHSTATR